MFLVALAFFVGLPLFYGVALAVEQLTRGILAHRRRCQNPPRTRLEDADGPDSMKDV